MATFTTSGQVPSTEGVIYTAPATDTQVKTFIFCNTGASQNLILKLGTLEILRATIASGATLEFSPAMPFTLASGGTFRASTTTTTTLSFVISGVTP